MNLLTNILNSKSYWTKCSSALCGIAMAEMGVRTIVDITKREEILSKVLENISKQFKIKKIW